MENGHEEKLADKLSELTVNNSPQSPDDSTAKNDSLFQVMKAVEAAEATIKQQVLVNFLFYQLLIYSCMAYPLFLMTQKTHFFK